MKMTLESFKSWVEAKKNRFINRREVMGYFADADPEEWIVYMRVICMRTASQFWVTASYLIDKAETYQHRGAWKSDFDEESRRLFAMLSAGTSFAE